MKRSLRQERAIPLFLRFFLKKCGIINFNQRRECMSNYRRTSKPKTEHIKKGFTVFQKTITTIGSILGLITATITIMNALDNNKNTKKEPTTTIVKEIQKESPQENTSPNKENNTSQEKTQQEETTKSSVKEEKKEEQKASTQDSSTPTPSKPAADNEKQSNTPTSENNTQ